MKTKTALIVAVLTCVLAVPAVAGAAPRSHPAQIWKNVSVLDQHAAKQLKTDPDALTRLSAIKHASGGFGFWTKDGRYLKLDKGGDEAWLDMLKQAKENNHLRANVTGVLHGDTIDVKSISLL